MYPNSFATVKVFTKLYDLSLNAKASERSPIQRCFIPRLAEVCRWIYKELKILF